MQQTVKLKPSKKRNSIFALQLNTAVYEHSLPADKVLSAVRLQLNNENIFNDTYIFEFLDLPRNYSEKDLRKALVGNLKDPSVGILLCKGNDEEVVGFALARNISPTMIADYETKLIDKTLLHAKLHELITLENQVRKVEMRYGR